MAAGPGVCRPQADELHGSLREFEREKDQSGEQVDDTVLQRARFDAPVYIRDKDAATEMIEAELDTMS